MKPRHSNTGAMSPMDPKFSPAILKAQAAIQIAVDEFERETGRTVDGLSMGWLDVTQIQDPQPRTIRTPHLSWLPMPGEFD
jgi:hypothetical protein